MGLYESNWTGLSSKIVASEITPVSIPGPYTTKGLIEDAGCLLASVARLKIEFCFFSPKPPTIPRIRPGLAVLFSNTVMADCGETGLSNN